MTYNALLLTRCLHGQQTYVVANTQDKEDSCRRSCEEEIGEQQMSEQSVLFQEQASQPGC